jgi:mevalonate kinase
MSHPKIDSIVTFSLELGLATKITGAGGGGCLLTYLDSKVDEKLVLKFKTLIDSEGMSWFETRLGVCGVTGISCQLHDFTTLSFSNLRNKLRLG